MTERWARPLYVDAEGRKHVPVRVQLGNPPFSEGELQALLAEYPELLPVEQFDPAFDPPICLGREIPTGSGPVDLLCVSPDGYITLVETKLWKNPQARREVIGQIIDYTKQMAQWTYGDLEDHLRRAHRAADSSSRSLYEFVAEKADEPPDEAEFVDAVSRCLRYGRFLLLVVGDGIHESVEDMAAYLQETPHLHFTLGLVEIACYGVGDGEPSPLMLVPHIVAKTAEITRAIVRVEATPELAEKLGISVSIPRPDPDGKRQRLSREEYYERLAESSGRKEADALRQFIDDLVKQHDLLSEALTTKRMRLKFEVPGSDANPKALLDFKSSGEVYASPRLRRYLARHGCSPELSKWFYARLGDVNEGLAREERSDGALTPPQHTAIAEIVARFDKLREVIGEFLQQVEKSSGE